MYNPLLLARYHPQIPTVTIDRRINRTHLCVRLQGSFEEWWDRHQSKIYKNPY